MSNSIPGPAPKNENKVDLIPTTAGIVAGGTVAATASTAGLTKALAAVTAAGTVASGFSYFPTIATATLAGVEVATGWPVIRVGFALAAAVATGLAARFAIKLGRAGVNVARQTITAAKAIKEVMVGSQRPSMTAASTPSRYQYSVA